MLSFYKENMYQSNLLLASTEGNPLKEGLVIKIPTSNRTLQVIGSYKSWPCLGSPNYPDQPSWWKGNGNTEGSVGIQCESGSGISFSIQQDNKSRNNGYIQTERRDSGEDCYVFGYPYAYSILTSITINNPGTGVKNPKLVYTTRTYSKSGSSYTTNIKTHIYAIKRGGYWRLYKPTLTSNCGSFRRVA